VWLAIQPERAKFSELLSVSAPGQSRCTIYKRRENYRSF
jgi:hypothetical protein